MNDSLYDKKLSSLKMEIEESIQKLGKMKTELDDLSLSCDICINSARQALKKLEEQIQIVREPGKLSDNSSKDEQSSILIVEDETNVRELLKEFVSSQGCSVFTAEDGLEAISVFQKQNFDLVFLDLKLPGLSGVEVLRKMKETRPSTKVVVVSGNSGELKSVQDRSLRPQWVIPKPFKLQQIREALSLVGVT